MTQVEATKRLFENAQLIASGLGLKVKYEIESEIPGVGHKPNVVEGLRETAVTMSAIMKGAGVSPQELMVTQLQPKQLPSGLIV